MNKNLKRTIKNTSILSLLLLSTAAVGPWVTPVRAADTNKMLGTGMIALGTTSSVGLIFGAEMMSPGGGAIVAASAFAFTMVGYAAEGVFENPANLPEGISASFVHSSYWSGLKKAAAPYVDMAIEWQSNTDSDLPVALAELFELVRGMARQVPEAEALSAKTDAELADFFIRGYASLEF